MQGYASTLEFHSSKAKSAESVAHAEWLEQSMGNVILGLHEALENIFSRYEALPKQADSEDAAGMNSTNSWFRKTV